MSLATNITDLTTRIGTETKNLRTLLNGNTLDNAALTTTATNLLAAINELDGEVGTLASLDTTAKATLVAAINETLGVAQAAASGGVSINDAATNTTATWSSSKIAGEIDADVSAALTALVDGSPGLLDTLNELAAAIGDDPNFAATMTTALGNRVRTDTAAQGLTAPQQTNARTNIGAASDADVGATDTNFVTVFETALA